MNCSRRKARYRYSTTVFRIGVTVFPNGQHRSLLVVEGALPTKLRMTTVVSQYEAARALAYVTAEVLGDHSPSVNQLKIVAKML